MTEMVRRGRWVVLPYYVVRYIPCFSIRHAGVVPQCDKLPRLIVDYTFSGVNNYTVPLAPSQHNLDLSSSACFRKYYRLTRSGSRYLS